jgi:hypothetical protein
LGGKNTETQNEMHREKKRKPSRNEPAMQKETKGDTTVEVKSTSWQV